MAQTGRPGRSVYVPTCTREEATKTLLDDFLARVSLVRAPGHLIRMLKNERQSAADRTALEEILRESRPRPRSTPPSSEGP